ncbi:MAG: hypothetical protein ACT4PX_04060 [Actinomycetota bacterium]
MTSTSEYAADGTTLVEIIRRFEERGYRAQMAAEPGCLLRCFACRVDSPAAAVHLDALRRTEGASDPADMVAVAAVRCPSCGAGGTVALKYGPGATPEEAEVLHAFDALGPEPGVPHRA